MGPSGCGKSTLLHLLGGLDRPTAGEVLLGGRRVDQLSEAALGAAAPPRGRLRLPVLQPDRQPHGRRQRRAARPARRRCRRARRARAGASCSTTLGLARAAPARSPAALSGGQQQRVAIARALVNRPARPAGRRADRQPRQPRARARSSALLRAPPRARPDDRPRHPRRARGQRRRPRRSTCATALISEETLLSGDRDPGALATQMLRLEVVSDGPPARPHRRSPTCAAARCRPRSWRSSWRPPSATLALAVSLRAGAADPYEKIARATNAADVHVVRARPTSRRSPTRPA